MKPRDPLALLEALCRRLMRRAPERWTPDDLEDLVDAVIRLAEERPDFVEALPAADITLIADVVGFPMAALNLAIAQTPHLVDSFTEEQLRLVMRFGTPQVRAIAQHRLDAIRNARAH